MGDILFNVELYDIELYNRVICYSNMLPTDVKKACSINELPVLQTRQHL